jgi:hypothetical protein
MSDKASIVVRTRSKANMQSANVAAMAATEANPGPRGG